MCTAAKLGGEIPHLDNTDFLAVLLAKQCHRARLLCFIQGHNIGYNRQGCCNLIIYNLFNLLYLLWSHRREMSKVETQTVTGYQGTSLLYMATKYGTQRFMKQMGCGMVAGSQFTVFLVNRHGYFFSHLEHTLYYNTDMTDLATL